MLAFRRPSVGRQCGALGVTTTTTATTKPPAVCSDAPCMLEARQAMAMADGVRRVQAPLATGCPLVPCGASAYLVGLVIAINSPIQFEEPRLVSYDLQTLVLIRSTTTATPESLSAIAVRQRRAQVRVPM